MISNTAPSFPLSGQLSVVSQKKPLGIG